MPANIIQGLTVWDYAVVILYGAAMLGVGALYSGRQTDLGEYFLGRRSMSWLVVGISTMATLVSTITYLTTPGEIIKNGPGVLWGQLAVIFAFFIIGYLIVPRIMAQQIVSGYQILEAQFGHGIRQAAAVLFVLIRIAWMGLVVYTCSVALAAMTGWRLEYILIGVGVVTTIYTSMGGIRAVMITDVTQASILFFGAVLIIIYVMIRSHSMTAWWPDLGDPKVMTMLNWPHVPLFPTALSQRITVFSIIFMYVIWWVATASSDQMAIQRYLSTKNVFAARKSFLTNTAANLALGTVLALCGFALLGFFLKNLDLLPSLKVLSPNAGPEVFGKMAGMDEMSQKYYTLRQGADKIFPWFIANVLPPGLSGLLLAALFSAAMSSISSGINSITSVLMVDFKNIFARNVEEGKQVVRARKIGFSIGAIAILVSYLQRLIQGNFMEVAQKINLFFVAPLGALFLMAFFMKRVNKQGAWASIVAGVLVGVFVSYFSEIYGFLTGKEGYISFAYTLPFSLAASLIVGYLVSLAFPPPKSAR